MANLTGVLEIGELYATCRKIVELNNRSSDCEQLRSIKHHFDRYGPKPVSAMMRA